MIGVARPAKLSPTDRLDNLNKSASLPTELRAQFLPCDGLPNASDLTVAARRLP